MKAITPVLHLVECIPHTETATMSLMHSKCITYLYL